MYILHSHSYLHTYKFKLADIILCIKLFLIFYWRSLKYALFFFYYKGIIFFYTYTIINFSFRTTMYICSNLSIISFYYLTFWTMIVLFIHQSHYYAGVFSQMVRNVAKKILWHFTCPKDLNSRIVRSLEVFRRRKPLRNMLKTRPVRVLIRYISDSTSFSLIEISDDYVKYL